MIKLKHCVSGLALSALVGTGLSISPSPAHSDDLLKKLAIGVGVGVIANEVRKSQKKKKQVKAKKSTKKSKSTTSTRAAAPRKTGPRPTIATFPTTREQVRDYQSKLNSLGYNAGAPDGLYGGKTRRAVSAFQTSIGVAATGVLTEADAGILVQQSNQFATGLANVAQPRAGVTAPAPAFPATGAQVAALGATAGAGAAAVVAAPAPAFPQLGAPTAAVPGGAAPQPPAPAFPQLGATTATGAATAATPAFPQLGTTTVAPQPAAPAPAFPQLAPVESQPVGTLALAPVAHTQPQPTFPTLGTAPAPQIDQAPNPVITPAVTVPIPQTVETFSILGVSTADPLPDALATLATEGYAACETIGTVTHCVKQSSPVQDIVSLTAVPMANGEVTVAAMARRLDFSQPMPRKQLDTMMTARYATLLTTQNQVIATDDCRANASVAEMPSAQLSDLLFSEDQTALASVVDSCSGFSRIVYDAAEGSEAISKLSIYLYEGTVFAASPERPTAAAAIKF